MIICISINGTPPISRIWPIPMVVGAVSDEKEITIWPDEVTSPCMLVVLLVVMPPM